MSRTSNALKRFGVAGLAAVTLGAGAPVFFATAAQAAATTQLSITPANSSAAAGTCQVITVTPRDADGNVATDTPTITVELSENPESNTQFVSFCDPNDPDGDFSNGTTTGSAASGSTAAVSPGTAGTGGTDTQTAPGVTTGGDTARQTFNSPRATAAVVFGVRSNVPGGASIRAFVGSGTFQAGQIQATTNVTFTAGGTNTESDQPGGNAAQDAVRTITDVSQNTTFTANRAATFTVEVRNANNDTVSGVQVSARITSGPNGPQTTGSTTTAAAPVTCGTTNNAGRAVCQYTTNADRTGTDTIQVFVNQTSGTTAGPDAGEPTLTITRQVGPEPQTNPALARNISLTPESTTTAAGSSQVFTATVTGVGGRPVQGVTVTFVEEGPGRFTTGTNTITATTNASGQATVTTNSVVGETGTQVITASISSASTECGSAAGAGTGATSTTPAGNCSDTSTQTFVAASPSPSASATPTASASPSASPTGSASPSPTATAGQRLGISVSPATITPGVQVVVVVRGTPGTIVELQAYSRPNTTYQVVRRGTILEDGTITFRVLPGTNTRLFARVTGTTAQDSPSVVINVRTALSLTVVRNGSLDYTFQGRILPRRAGQLITLYRVTADGREIITSQIRTDNTGTYFIRRIFVGQGTFGFLTRTGQTLTNAAGVSNGGRARPTAIYAGPQR